MAKADKKEMTEEFESIDNPLKIQEYCKKVDDLDFSAVEKKMKGFLTGFESSQAKDKYLKTVHKKQFEFTQLDEGFDALDFETKLRVIQRLIDWKKLGKLDSDAKLSVLIQNVKNNEEQLFKEYKNFFNLQSEFSTNFKKYSKLFETKIDSHNILFKFLDYKLDTEGIENYYYKVRLKKKGLSKKEPTDYEISDFKELDDAFKKLFKQLQEPINNLSEFIKGIEKTIEIGFLDETKNPNKLMTEDSDFFKADDLTLTSEIYDFLAKFASKWLEIDKLMFTFLVNSNFLTSGNDYSLDGSGSTHKAGFKLEDTEKFIFYYNFQNIDYENFMNLEIKGFDSLLGDEFANKNARLYFQSVMWRVKIFTTP
jgi:hypothetical protein